ncbi:hypothetical protein TrRE_jg13554 [Triparma retinervis]|uniref:Limiting CO2-inducible protein B/C beta carbonyic anhydrase domain-containing protein n=1 Tax=Triparma retinervis TaxID=2557542 RepID=A0A9W7A883_9STRA|nr:hypothetical protein TrRE_jg13554 [Triparma retinervis]
MFSMFANSNSYDDDEEMYVGILQKHFGPNALPLNKLAKKMFDLVDGDDNGKKQLKDTLLVESTCSDGICREATANLEERWGGAFRIGGLSGFPFGGTSAVKEIANQAPDGGDVFLIYAPHVGFSGSCEIGRLERPGKDTEEPRCCESNLTAVNQVNKELRRNMVKKEQRFDAQQFHITAALRGKAMKQKDKNSSYHLEKEVAHTAVYKLITKEINDVFRIRRDVEEVTIEDIKGGVTLSRHALNKSKCTNFFVLGGIIVNTPMGMPDYFAPKRFEVHTTVGGAGSCSHVRDLLGVFDVPRVEQLGGLFCSAITNKLNNSDLSVWTTGKWKRFTQEKLPEGDSSWRKEFNLVSESFCDDTDSDDEAFNRFVDDDDDVSVWGSVAGGLAVDSDSDVE